LGNNEKEEGHKKISFSVVFEEFSSIKSYKFYMCNCRGRKVKELRAPLRTSLRRCKKKSKSKKQ